MWEGFSKEFSENRNNFSPIVKPVCVRAGAGGGGLCRGVLQPLPFSYFSPSLCLPPLPF